MSDSGTNQTSRPVPLQYVSFIFLSLKEKIEDYAHNALDVQATIEV